MFVMLELSREQVESSLERFFLSVATVSSIRSEISSDITALDFFFVFSGMFLTDFISEYGRGFFLSFRGRP